MFQCNHCDYSTNTEPALHSHKVKHKQAAGYTCEDCNESFDRTRTLMIHCIEEHNGQKCTHCEKRFRNRPYLVMHSKVNHVGLRYTCEVCRKEFLSKHGLKRHKNTHLGLKPYMCELCSKSFPDPGSLKQHKKIHNRSLRKTCTVPAKSIIGKSALCNDCGIEFKSKNTLTKHVKKLHTEQPRVDWSILREHRKEKVISLAVSHGVKHSSSRFSVKLGLVTKWVKEAGLQGVGELAQSRYEGSPYSSGKIEITNEDNSSSVNTTKDQGTDEGIEIEKLFVGESRDGNVIAGIEEDLEEGEIKESFDISATGVDKESENGKDMTDACITVESEHGEASEKTDGDTRLWDEEEVEMKLCSKKLLDLSNSVCDREATSSRKGVIGRKKHSKDQMPDNENTTTANIECDLCTFRTISIENARSHMKKVHIGAVFICLCCSERFVTRYDLNKHKSQSHKIQK